MAGDDPYLLKRPHADLDWAEAGPVARAPGDVYFSAANGLEESRAVFLAGAGFPERFGRDLTIVGELGFGTGLNVLALWDSFRRNAPSGARLHVVSVEGFPLRREDAARALGAFPELSDLAGALIEAWPSPHKGAHRRVFEDGRVSLTVFHDDAQSALTEMDFAADAWFLDGFAPAKNPDMWTPPLFAQIARLSKPGAPAATFTVAGAVRRGLAEAGFKVEKKPGFGRKRERLEAVFEGVSRPGCAPSPFEPVTLATDPIAVIGGGIAAASLVEALARRGREVRIFACGGWAAGASSAPLALVTPRLEAADRPHARALLNGFDYAVELYRKRGLLDRAGVLRLAAKDGADRLHRLAGLLDERYAWLEAEAASARLGARCEAGLWMAAAGTVRPAEVVAALAGDAPAADVEIAAVTKTDEDGWRLTGTDGARHGPFAAVIVAGGPQSGRLTGLSVEETAGRVAVFDSGTGLQAPAAWGGYAAPVRPGQVLVGATHVKGADPGGAEAAEAELRRAAGDGPLDLAAGLGACVESWGGVRAALADRLPAAGPAPDAAFMDRWRDAAQGRSDGPVGDGAGPDGLLVLAALGARGFAHAPLLAEHIAGALCGEPAAAENSGLEALHPARFAWRALKRGG